MGLKHIILNTLYFVKQYFFTGQELHRSKPKGQMQCLTWSHVQLSDSILFLVTQGQSPHINNAARPDGLKLNNPRDTKPDPNQPS